MTSLHLYLHIPFCHRICPYCSFYKHTPGDTDLNRFVETLLAEGQRRARELHSPHLETLYLGGGTPSMLSPTHMRRLMTGLVEIFPRATGAEMCLEANPATFSPRTAETYASLGFSRISLGAQSFDPATLATLGREHVPEDIAASVALLREAGIPNVSIDLMFSVPGQSLEDWRTTLERTVALSPVHISAYNLTYEEDTPFFEQFQRGAFTESEDLNARMFETAHDLLVARGYRHYETSNYALPGSESRHNQAYWAGADYLGLGPSAVSTIAGRRWKNVPDTNRYLHQVDAVGHAESESELLTTSQLALERLALLLRTDRGVPTRYLGEIKSERIEQLLAEDLAVLEDEHLSLTGRGPLLVDSIVEHLIRD